MTCSSHTPVAISVIIPTYNRAVLVTEAVGSALAQEGPDVEVIVVDDGSTDDTGRVLDAFGSRIIRVTQPNLGVSAARNAGADRASGSHLAFLDADDLWLPGKLARQAAFFQAHPGARICQTEEAWLKNGRRINPGKKHRKPSGMIFIPSLALCLVSPSAVMIERQFFQQMGGFDESLPACEDYDLWLRISCRYPIHLIPEALVIKRGGHADQLSAAPGLDKYRIRCLRKILETRPLTTAQRSAVQQTLREKCAIYAAGCEKRNRPVEAGYYSWIADTWQPLLP
ncbi:MAG: glycosyltransferase family 2 protein [Desulfosudaceae bacterium]